MNAEMFHVTARNIMPNCQPKRTTAMKRLLPCLTLLLIGFASSSLYAQGNSLYFNKENLRKNKIRMIAEAQ